MCGIAGVIKFGHDRRDPWPPFSADGDLPDPLAAMSKAIARRGPDGAGHWTNVTANGYVFRPASDGPFYPVALLHRRLAIVDLPGGAQPMANEDGNVHVIFNGEIYNHADLRSTLVAAGHRFASDHSDTETLVHGWEEWGEDLPRRLEGMFAFAAWDERAGTLFLARDRMGQKPLFYALLEDGLVFGSTIGAVLAWPGVPRRVPAPPLAEYLRYGYVTPPGTIYRDVFQVMPGHYVICWGDVVRGRAWMGRAASDDRHAQGAPGDREPRGQSAEAALRARLETAAAMQCQADVPVACFLSGGIDSSIVASLCQQQFQRFRGEPITTVAAAFPGTSFDESAHARLVANHIGSRHIELPIDVAADVPGLLADLTRHDLGQPFADSSIIPTWHVSKAARAVAPVALGGDGGDELFGGYDRYRAFQWLHRLGPVGRRALATGGFVAGDSKRIRRMRAAAAEIEGADRHASLIQIFPPSQILRMMPEAAAELGIPTEWEIRATVPMGEMDVSAYDCGKLSMRRWAMRSDQIHYLPGDVLWKVDSASMAHALEVRSPFLDARVVAFANGLPDRELFSRGRGKMILRRTFAADLPAETMERRKQGFGVPIGAWFRGALREHLVDMITRDDGFCRNHFTQAPIDALLAEHMSGADDHAHRLFALLMLEHWHDAYPSEIG